MPVKSERVTQNVVLQVQHECVDENHETYRLVVRERVHGWSMPPARCRGSLLLELAHQVKQLKEELISAKISGDFPVFPTEYSYDCTMRTLLSFTIYKDSTE